ncbi:MAG: polysaccharide pyruvyl transferase CsaB [bacterium]|nr:polysaccharide pyruvyl transferase CsaB [bacterium]
MTRLVISGYYGFGNAGDEAMLASMVRSFRSLDPGVGLTVLSADPGKTRANHDVRAVGRLAFPRIVAALASADALVSGAGSLLQDVTSRRNLFYYLGLMRLAQALRKPVIVYANGIGPLRSSSGRRAVAEVLARARLITVRDRQSLAELESMGLTGILSADPALAMTPPPPDRGREILEAYGLAQGGPLVVVAPRTFAGASGATRAMAGACDYLARTLRARILLVPMQSPGDDRAAAAIGEAMREPAAMLRGGLSPAELMSLVGESELLVGVRLHALIFAAVMGVPALGIAYDPKIPGFAASIGLPALDPQGLTMEDLLINLESLLRDRIKIRQDLAVRVEKLREQAENSARLTLERLGR